MEDDEDVSKLDEPSIQVDNNDGVNLLNVTNAEQYESVHDSRFVDDLQLAGESSEPAVTKDDIAVAEDAVEDKETVGDPQPAGELEPDSPKNYVAGVEKPEEDLQNPPEIERSESVREVDKSGPVVSEDSDDADVAVEEKAEELQKPSNDEPIAKLDDVKLVVESESPAMRDDDDVDHMVEDKEEEVRMIPDTDKCEPVLEEPKLVVGIDVKDGEDEDVVFKKEEETPETVSELEQLQPVSREASALNEGDDAVVKEEETSMAISERRDLQLGQESELAAVKEGNEDAGAEEEAQMEVSELDDSQLVVKDGDDEDVVFKKEEETPETVSELEQLRPVSREASALNEGDDTIAKEEETSMAISERRDLQLGQESELAAVKEDKEDAGTEEEAQMEDSELDDSQLVGEVELSVAKEDEDEDMGADEQEIPTAEEDEHGDTGADEQEIPTAEEDEFGDMGADEQEIPTAEQDENGDIGADEQEMPTAEEDEHGDMVAEEQEIPTADTEMMTETEVGRGSGKRKRGRNSKVTARAPVRKTVEEDVCFICFDGGDLVLCDRRGCPKAYHPSCVNRDEAFFRAKGRWNCGWHQCSICEKNAYYMCYTCTYSLCKGCIKDAVILCVRGNKGFCETCIKTVMAIERNDLGKGEMAKVDFDDKSSWEYLFKDYWSDLKGKLLLSLDEVAQAKNPWKGSDVLGDKQGSPINLYDANNEDGSGSDNPSGIKASTSRQRKARRRIKPITKEEDSASASDNSGNLDASKSKKRKAKKQSKSRAERDSASAVSAVSAEGTSVPSRSEWASKELLEFVMHMKDGDMSVLSQFDVQALLLDYIKKNKLRDPRRKSQIICDLRLQNLFGKPRVGHFEMLKLLESHFFIREDSQADDLQGTVVDTETSQLDVDESTDALTKAGKDRKRKPRRKGNGRALQSNVDDYAAIDTHNINLVYLRRNVMEALLEDSEYFYDKVVGSFVRIRISGSNQKQEMYRLVQVVGTSKAAEPYKVVKRMTDIILEIQNLNKKEVISMDIISNQEFTEDECKRLRQSIKCGLINRLTLGDIQEKAMALQEVRVNDWLEAEVVRLSHLCDRASETGRQKELRECVEKLQRLKTPEELQRRLEEIPEVHSDPKMDPSYESEEDEGDADDNKKDNYMRPRSTSFSRRGTEPISPRKGASVSNDSWSGARNSSSTRELSRNMSGRSFSNRREDAAVTDDLVNENTWAQERNRDRQQLNSWDRQKSGSTSEIGGRNSHAVVATEPFSVVLSETSPSSLSPGVAQATAKFSETDKMWLYRDPSGKVQGPFSMGQLRKWSNTGYFPKDLRIWRSTENQDDSLLLTNALTGNFQKESPQMENSFSNARSIHNPHLSSSYSGKLYGTALQSASEVQGGESSKGSSALSVEAPRVGTNGWNSEHGGRSDTSNLPSPTPSRTTAGNRGGQASEYNLSPNSFPAQTFSSAPKTPQGGQLSHLSTPPSASASLSRGLDGSNVSHATFTQQTNTEHNGIKYSGAMSPSVSSFSRKLTQGSENELPSSFPNASSTLQPEIGISSENALQFQAGGQVLLRPEPAAVSADQSADTGGAGGSLPNLVQSGTTYNPSIESLGWSSGSVATQKVEQSNQSPMQVQQPVYSQWGSATSSSVHNSASSFNTVNPGGNLPIAGFSGSTDSWRPPVPVNQSNMQPAAPPNLPWVMGNTENLNATPRPGQESNTVWGPMLGNPNMGWGGTAPGNTNMNWVATAQGPLPGNGNQGWVASGQGPAPGTVNPNWATAGQGPPPGNANPNWVSPAPGNTNQGWVPSGQGTPPGNVNPNWVAPGNANPPWVAPGNAFPSWVASSQGPPPGNANPNWVAPGNTNPGWIAPGQVPAPGIANSGWIAPGQGPAVNSNLGWVPPNPNPGMWGSEQSHNGDRNQRDRPSQVGHSGNGGGRAWNRQSSIGSGGGGDSSRPPPRVQRLCDFHLKGHCKKGSSCDHMHH